MVPLLCENVGVCVRKKFTFGSVSLNFMVVRNILPNGIWSLGNVIFLFKVEIILGNFHSATLRSDYTHQFNLIMFRVHFLVIFSLTSIVF